MNRMDGSVWPEQMLLDAGYDSEDNHELLREVLQIESVIPATSVFMHGKRPEAEATLDPSAHPLPWLFESTSSGDNRFTFTGVPELFFARTPEDFDAILPKVPVAAEEPEPTPVPTP